MFRKLRQKMKRRVTPRKERADAVRVRGVLERLEDRAMLSAHGLTDFGHGGQDFRPRMEAGPRFSDSPAVASQQQRSMSYETQTFSGGREFGGPHGELQYPPPMQMAFQPSARTRPFEQHPFQNPSWNQPFADQPPTFIFFEEAPHFEPPIAESHGALPRVISKPPFSVVPPGDILGSLNASNRPLAIDHFQALPVPLEQVRSTITSGAGVLAIGWTLPDVPTGLQIYSREIMTAGALSTVAREVAF